MQRKEDIAHPKADNGLSTLALSKCLPQSGNRLEVGRDGGGRRGSLSTKVCVELSLTYLHLNMTPGHGSRRNTGKPLLVLAGGMERSLPGGSSKMRTSIVESGDQARIGMFSTYSSL